MPVNPYFNNIEHRQEQDLQEDLVVEFIQIHGIDVYYIPRKLVNPDWLFGEDTVSKFKNAYIIETIFDPVTSWGGAGDTISRFGFEIRDEVKLYFAKRRFTDLVTDHEPEILKPREGDIIAGVIDTKRLWEIKFVNDERDFDFHMFGKDNIFEVTCELLAYDQEDINTNIPEIDSINDRLYNDTDNLENIKPITDNDNIQKKADSGIINFDVRNPFGDF